MPKLRRPKCRGSCAGASLIGSTRNLTVYAFSEPTDMRKGYNGLQALVENELQHDVTSGQLYLFVARNQKRAKVLFWDGTGLCIYMKRLEAGQFIAPWARSVPTMTLSELTLFLEGCDALRSTSLSPSQFFPAPLRSKDCPRV